MRLIIYFFVLGGFLFSCANHEVKQGLVDNIDQECFQYMIQNKTKEFLKRLPDCKNAHDRNGLPALFMAIAKENIDLVEAMIEAKVDVNQVDPAGLTALVFAANKNNSRIVQLLRRAGARIEVVNNNLTGLMMAVKNSSIELIQVMNPTVEEINIRAEDGWSAVYFAISRRDLDILTYLLDHGACTQQVDTYRQRPIDFAREERWKEAIALLGRKTKC